MIKTFFKNLKVGKKLFIAFAIVLTLYIITVITSVVNIGSLANRIQEMYQGPFSNVQHSLEISSRMQNVGRNISILTCVDGIAGQEEYIAESRELIGEIGLRLNSLSEGYISGQKEVEKLLELYKQMEGPRDQVLELIQEGKREDGFQVYIDEYSPALTKTTNQVAVVVEASIKDAEDSLNEGINVSKRIIMMILILAVSSILFSIILGIMITKSVVKPVYEVKKAANSISNGYLDVQIEYDAKDELGQLANDIRNTAEALSLYVSEIRTGMLSLGSGKLNYQSDVTYKGDFVEVGEALRSISKMLRESMMQIGSSAEQVSSSAEQVSNGAQTLAQGASEQASSIEELAVSINEIAESVQENAQNAVKSSQLADEVGISLEKSDEQMKELLESIQLIKKNSSEITGIIKEIEDIAFQTNILALNASVEAARAGEAGRGFSVVAGEVRRLASKTTEASKVTAGLIEKNTEAVNAGMQAVDSAAHTMKKTVVGAREVNQMVDKISGISVQQAEAISQIRRSVEMISDIVQGNTATSEESAAASEELSAQAEILKELVEQFEV